MSNTRVWFVTGSSSGFGLEVVKHVLEHGDIVVATLRQPETLSSLTGLYGADQLLLVKLDVTQPQDILDAFAKAKGQFGRVDVVFNNAGIGILGEIEATPDARARELFEINFWGAVNVTREAVRFFREENEPGRGGKLIQNSSMHGLVTLPDLGFYAAAKHALEAVSETLSKEVDPSWNIKIIIMEAGIVFGTSLMKPTGLIPAPSTYERAPSSTTREWFAEVARGNIAELRSSDITKVGAIIWKLSLLPDPPLRLALGEDSLDLIKQKLASVADEVNQYEAWTDEV